MGLDYSQKQLLHTASRKKGGHGRGTISHMRRKRSWRENLEIYAFATGIMSTLISLVHVIILATKK